MANGPDILGAISQGLALREQRQGAPARRELQGLQLQGARDQARVQSIIQSAQQLKLITTPEGKIDFLQQQRAQRQQAGTGTQEIDEALELAQAGRFDLLEDITDRAIAFGSKISGKGLTPRQRELAQFQALPETTPEEKTFKQQFGQAIGAIAKRAGVEERTQIQQAVGDIKVAQDIVKAGGAEQAKLKAQLKDIPERERTQFLSKNREVFRGDIAESRSALDEIDRAIEIWESAPGTVSGPIASRLPSLTQESQELESILAGLGIDRLANFKGATSERELATAFRAGASIEQDREAGIKRLKKQRRDITRNNDRLRGLLGEANSLLRDRPTQAAPESRAAPQTFTSSSGISFTVE